MIIFSHGFGVQKDARGMFTDMAAAMPETSSTLIDFNDVDQLTGQVTISPFSEQARRLEVAVASAVQAHPNEPIDLICHSQGCVIASIATLPAIRSALFLAPPDVWDVDDMLEYFGGRDGTTIDLQGMSELGRSDGSKTLVPTAYWQECRDVMPMAAYKRFVANTPVTIVRVPNDNVIGQTNFAELSVTVVDMEGDHDFTGTARQKIVDFVPDWQAQLSADGASNVA